MKYTLTWKVTHNEPAPCPDYQPDPYTGQYPSFHCLVYHFRTVVDDRAKDFETKIEAMEFFKNAPRSCSEFKLNGKLLKERRFADTPNLIIGDLTGTGGGTTMLTNTVTGTGVVKLNPLTE